MENEIETIKNELYASPMYNLSLSSKELFHSNFLEWLGNNQETKAFFVNVIKDMTNQKVKLPNDDSWEVKREEKNFDLCIKSSKKSGRDYLLIIENKVKSIPRKDQLDEYKEKIKEYYNKEINVCPTRFLLLTLAKEFPHKEEIDKDVWEIKTYENLAETMKNQKKYLNGYYLSLVEDYLGFIGNLNALVGKWQKNDVFADAQDLNGLGKLSDLHAKIQFSSYCVKLKDRIGEIGGKIVVFDKIDKGDKFFSKNFDNSKVYIWVDWGFSSFGKKGILDIAIPVTGHKNPQILYGCLDPEYVIKIQVEGRSYRHVIEAFKNTIDLVDCGTSSPYTDCLKWFSKNPSCNNARDVYYGNKDIFKEGLYPKSKESLRNKDAWPFKSYTSKTKINFIYQSKDIRNNACVDDVIENMKNEIEYILNTFSK